MERLRTGRDLLLFGLPVTAAVVVLALVNQVESGSPFRSGYHEQMGASGCSRTPEERSACR